MRFYLVYYAFFSGGGGAVRLCGGAAEDAAGWRQTICGANRHGAPTHTAV